MDGFDKRRNEKKKAISQTAIALFDRYGFDKVTVNEIAEKAHVSKVSIYNYFGSKNNLRRAIVKEMLAESLRSVQQLIEKEVSFVDKIEEYIQIRTSYFGKHSLQFIIDAVESDTEIRQYMEDFNATNKKLALKFIDQGKRAGVFSPDISDNAIQISIDMFQTYLLQNKESRDAFEHNPKLAEEVNWLFMNGLIRGNDSGKA